MLRTAYGVILSLFVSTAAYGQCLQADSPEPVEVSGTLQFQIFPGPPNFEDVRKGDRPHPAYILRLNSPICLTGDNFTDEDVSGSQIHLMTDSDGMEAGLRSHVRQPVIITISRAFARHTAHHKAPILAYVEEVAPIGSDEGMTTVEAFYLALAAGSGSEAAKFIIPEKRMKGPFSAKAMTRFYGNLYEPLSLISVKPLQSNQFMVHYRFRQSPNSTCNGRSIVNVEMNMGGYLIKSIRALDGC